MIVMKFGGTSLGNAKTIAEVSVIIKKAFKKRPVVVVSAVTKMTDALVALANNPEDSDVFNRIKNTHSFIIAELKLPPSLLKKEFEELENLISKTKKNKKLDAKTLDHFQSFGELMSAKIVAAQLTKIGVVAKALPAWEIGMITDNTFGNAQPLFVSARMIQKKIRAEKMMPIVTGFIGKTQKGEITTLGRGGSDYSAAIIGAAIGASIIQIWTDVDGIMTADPRIVPQARIVPELAFEEACELAYFGAKVLHPKMILPAMEKNIPVQVLNTFYPQGKGTIIVKTFASRREKSHTVEAFACKKNITIIHLRSPEFFDGNMLMSRIFNLLEKHKIIIDLFAISVVGISFTIDNQDHIDKIIFGLKEMGNVTIRKEKAIICVVGGSVNAAGVSGKIFTALRKARISVEMISQAASGISMTFVVDQKEADLTMNILHKGFKKIFWTDNFLKAVYDKTYKKNK